MVIDKSELSQYQYQLDSVNLALSQDPDNKELKDLKLELIDLITLTKTYFEDQIKETEANTKSFSQVRYEYTETYKTGETVMARWVSGDNAFYPAKITSVTGSSTNTVYTVKFLEYNTIETLQAYHVKPISEGKKRAIEIEQKRPPPPPSVANAPPLPSKKKKPIRAKDELIAGQRVWQSFSQKGVKRGRTGKVERIGEKSIFRSPEEFGGKVGVIGSGKGMTKESWKRSRYHFEQIVEDD
ncbi:hypothetical protein MERGE_000641 [Pneumocystis wakefieldiae]|uniref:Tudor domain-containing protein n=1 Tax=Pneumocystis wakefieldiae TaxID=38082 RepID=A0A899G138_9ASCO|nr:hypothetical protein MERGE_000641 [Pneumocystis wakefieldiae]